MNSEISDYELCLLLGHLPKFTEASLDWVDLGLDREFGAGGNDIAWWVGEGVKAMKKMMADEVAATNANAVHVVLLSGGLDSRVILGGLLENLPKSQIVTATYGIPGAWDFEIAKTIARKFGLRHEVFNLLDEDWDVDRLVAAATRLRSPVSVHQSYVRQKINDHFGVECVYWSGFMGDALSGVVLPVTPSKDKREAVERYIKLDPAPNYKNQEFRNNLVEKMLREIPWEYLDRKNLTLDQQLFIGLWQKQLTRHITTFEGFNFRTPFLNKTWVNFMINAPYKWLLNKYLYKEIIRQSYRDLAKLGTTEYSAGMSLFHDSKIEIFLGKVISRLKPYIMPGDPYRSHPRTNYVNWSESLRHEGSLQDSVYSTLSDLKKRAILDSVEIDNWWHDHLQRKTDYSRLLVNLSSLELLLKAGVMK